MPDVLADIEELRRAAQATERARAKREADRDLAKDRLREAARLLKAEFGVASLDEARALEATMQGELEAGIAELRDKMREDGQ